MGCQIGRAGTPASLSSFVRLNMRTDHQETPEPPNRRVGWSIYGAAVIASCLICAALAPWGLFPLLSGGAWSWVAVAFGVVIALIVNLVRPRYETAVGKWRAFYDFLLRQMPPPD